MIEYTKGAYGLNLLIRVHGSAVYKAVIPGMISVMIFLLIREFYRQGDNYETLEHPYAVGVLVSSVSFIIIFRANYGYQRYWEACGAVHQMSSKWLDATVHTAAFHMQCAHYKDIKPPTFFEHPELLGKKLCRDRSRSGVRSIVNVGKSKKGLLNPDIKDSPTFEEDSKSSDIEMGRSSQTQSQSSDESLSSEENNGGRVYGRNRVDGGWGLLVPKNKWANGDSWASDKTPSLFLQELCHLSSLLVAVAFSTLRNDVEGGESPLDIYIPGKEWPAADSEKLAPKENAGSCAIALQKFVTSFTYWLGMDRTPEARTKYNASRPMHVLGGVSDGEIEMLQRARGPGAKTTLASMWLSEFIIREQLAGSCGQVGPPIISRLFQFLSDGMIFYNHAKKIMYTPFPFPHAQMSALFVLVIMMAVPFMMEEYANSKTIGCLLTFATVTCLAGLHEVARELERPFRNVPNDIPLCTLLAMYNESLISACSGYHPDSYWSPGIPQKR